MNKIAVIPVRSGSKRLPKKNYLSFNSRNIAQIARDKCLSAGVFDKVIISSDDPYFEELANCNKVEFLLRNKNLAGDDATTDKVIDFFFKQFDSCESILWVNSVSPLQSIQDIKNTARTDQARPTVAVLATGGCIDTIASVKAGFKPIWATEINEIQKKRQNATLRDIGTANNGRTVGGTRYEQGGTGSDGQGSEGAVAEGTIDLCTSRVRDEI